MPTAGLYDNLANLDPGGTPPRTRIKDALAARNMFSTAWRAYEKRHRRNALVKGLVDGNPPWPDKTKDAQRYRANFNNGEAYAYLETSMTAFYDVFSEPETYATVTLEDSNPEAQVWAEKITLNFDWLQKQDDAFDFNVQQSIHDMVLYGTGPQLFLWPMDWRTRAVPSRTMYVSDDAKANVADWEWVMFQFDYSVGELYEYISDEETARSLGWDVKAVKESIMGAKPQSWSGQAEWNVWENWQQALRNNDLYLSSQCSKVRVVVLLYKEFSRDGAPPKISEVWVNQDSGVTDQFLKRKLDAYDDMRQVVTAGYYDRGDGTHQSIKGLGVKMFPLLTSRMRLQLAAIDAAFATSTVFLQSNMPAGKQTLSNVQIGAFTVLPAGLGIQQANLQGVLEPAMAMSQDMGRTLDNNLSQYRQRMELPTGNPPTKYQVQAQLAQSATLGKTQLARYYQQLDELYTEKFRRAISKDIHKGTNNKWLKLALEFQKRCKDDGVPYEAFKKAVVRATRIAGQGSPFMREQALNQLYATLYPTLPEDGKMHLVRDIVSATVGPALTARYYNTGAPSQYESEQVWQAQVEHGLLFDGGAVNVTPQQNDTIHLTQHFQFLQGAAGSLEGGADPAEVFNTLMSGRAHVAIHLTRLASQPMRKNEFEQFKQLFDQLSQTIDGLQQQLQEQAQKQAEAQQAAMMAQQGADADTIKLQSKIANDRLKAESQVQLKQLKTEQDMRIKDIKTAQDLQLKQATTAQQLTEQALLTQQQVEKQAITNAGLVAKARIEASRPQSP